MDPGHDEAQRCQVRHLMGARLKEGLQARHRPDVGCIPLVRWLASLLLAHRVISPVLCAGVRAANRPSSLS